MKTCRCPRAIRLTRRTGSSYIAILGVALIVSMIATAAISIQRIQRHRVEDDNAALHAKHYSQVALRLGVDKMVGDGWRSVVANGFWEKDVELQGGTFTIHGVDPVDTDFTDDVRDPILLTGIGRHGDAEQRTKVTLVPNIKPLASLATGLWAGETLSITDSAVFSELPIGSNTLLQASGAEVWADAECTSTVSGDTFHRTIQENGDARNIPAADELFPFYQGLAADIDYVGLPTQTPRLIFDGGFEVGTSLFAPLDEQCTIERTTAQASSGSASLKVANRVSPNSGAVLDVRQWIQSGQKLTVFSLLKGAAAGGQLRVDLFYKALGSSAVNSTIAGPNADATWQTLNAEFQPTFNGSLDYAYLIIRIASVDDYYVDDVDVRLSTTNGRFLFRQVIGPQTHQSDVNDSDGVYAIDCKDQNIYISNCRIHGTLILVNPGAGSRIANGPIQWESAMENYPTLLIQADDPSKSFGIRFSRDALSETMSTVNFNPSGLPFAGEADSDTLDRYPSMIKGAIYSNAALSLSGALRIEGTVIAVGEISLNCANLEISTLEPMQQFPPVGFRKPTTFRILPNSLVPTVSMINY
jgi:hypothetical protein